MRRARILPTVALLILMLVLAWHGLGRIPWLDEIITLQELAGEWLQKTPDIPPLTWTTVAEGPASLVAPTDIDTLRAILWVYDVHPPLYYRMALVWSWMGGLGTDWLRLLSVLMATGAGAAMLALAILMGHLDQTRLTAGLTGVVVLACSPNFAYATLNVRNYALVLFLCSVSLWCLARLWNRPDHRSMILATTGAITAGCACATHHFAVLAMAGPLLVTAVRFGNRPRVLAGAILGFFLPFLPTLPVLILQSGARPGQYTGFDGWFSESGAALRSIALNLQPSFYLDAIPWLMTIVVWGAVLCAFGQARTRPAIIPALALLVCFPAALVAVFSATDKSLKEAVRYGIFALPALVAVFAALGASFHEGMAKRARTATGAGNSGGPAGGVRGWTPPPVPNSVHGALIGMLTLALIFTTPVGVRASMPGPYDAAMKAVSRRIEALGPEHSLIVLPQWAPQEGALMARAFPPDTPMLVVGDVDAFDAALDIAATKDVVLLPGLWSWSRPAGINDRAHDRLVEEGGLIALDSNGFVFTREPLP